MVERVRSISAVRLRPKASVLLAVTSLVGVAGFEPVFFLLIPAGRVLGRGFGFVPRALTNAVLVVVLGRPVLSALRRASRSAAFDVPVLHEMVLAGPTDDAVGTTSWRARGRRRRRDRPPHVRGGSRRRPKLLIRPAPQGNGAHAR